MIRVIKDSIKASHGDGYDLINALRTRVEELDDSVMESEEIMEDCDSED